MNETPPRPALKCSVVALGVIKKLIKSTSRLPSDLHISPYNLIGMSRRYNLSYGLEVFQSTADAKVILQEMAASAKEYT